MWIVSFYDTIYDGFIFLILCVYFKKNCNIRNVNTYLMNVKKIYFRFFKIYKFVLN
jgi:hypothetical protein